MSNPSPRKQNTKHSQQAMNRINQENQKNHKPSKRNLNRRISQQRKTPSQNDMFYASLTCPFDPAVLGVQVPDPFPFPTQVFHVHQTTVIGNTLGTGCIAFLPNPVLSMIDIGAVNTLGVTKGVQTTPFPVYSTSLPVSNTCNHIYGAVNSTAISDVFADYRTVSWGIKISNLMPELAATGRMIIACIPLGDTIPSYPELANAVSPQTLTSIFGISPQFLGTSNILELPTGFQLTAQDLLHGDIEIGGMYSSADYWDFKTTQKVGVLADGFPIHVETGDSVAVRTDLSTGATSPALVGFKDMTRCRGGSAILIYFEGMPGSQVVNQFQVETIYHLEGTPNFSSTENNALISSTARKTSVGSSHTVEQVMTRASKMENVITWISKGADFLNQNKADIFNIGKKVGLAAMTLM